tara:strand:- start:183 stop:461 length:279 start_codon:yes stop_codon:yes gene_type:complete
LTIFNGSFSLTAFPLDLFEPLDLTDLFDFVDFIDLDLTMEVELFGSAFAALLEPLEATEDDLTIFFGLLETAGYFLIGSFLATGSFLFLGAL